MKFRNLSLSFLLTLATTWHPCIAANNAEEEWHKLMHAANTAFINLDFDKAETLVKRAENAAINLSEVELNLTQGCAGAMFEAIGKYDLATATYSKSKNSEINARALSNVLEKQGLNEQAKELQKSFRISNFKEWNTGNLLMPEAQAAIKKIWHRLLPKEPSRHLITSTSGNWATLIIQIHPDLKTAAYVKESGGDEAIDTAALKSVESAKLHLIGKSLKKPIDIIFTFDYNLFSGTSFADMHGYNERKERQLRDVRDLLGWQEKHLGVTHPEVACTLTSATNHLEDLKMNADAERAIEMACKIWESNNISCQSKYETLKKAGDIYLKNKKYAKAITVLRESSSLATTEFGEESYENYKTNELLVSALKKCGKSIESNNLQRWLQAQRNK